MAEERIKSAAQMNDAVLRITGIKRAVLEDKKDVAQRQRQLAEVADRSDPGPDHKSFAPRETNSVTQSIPNHEMPAKKPDAKQPGVDEYDDEEQVVAKPEQGAKKESIMNKTVASTGLKDMAEWRMLAGLTPMYESVQRGTGEVPTAGVNKQNKMKAGLPGLEGTAVQDIEPKQTDDMGDNEEETFDAAPGDLKKTEEYNRQFAEFLEGRGLTAELFSQLVDEAMESNDVEEMNALLAVEGLFDAFRKKGGGSSVDKNMEQLKRTKQAAADRKAGKVDIYGRKTNLNKIKAGVGEAAEEFTFECDDDGTGNPDWKSAFKKMKRK